MKLRTQSLAAAGVLALLFVGFARGVAAAPVEVVAATENGAQQPQVAIDAAGNVYVVYGVGEEIRVAVSTDRGAHFQAPTRVAKLPKLALGMRRGPRIAAGPRGITVTAMDVEDVFGFHSDDAGKTWGAPVRINSVRKVAGEGLGGLAVGPDGSLYIAWLDSRSGNTEIYGALSRDGGKSWGANELVYHSPDGHTCECCEPTAAFNARGDLAVMWRNWLGGSRDMWMAVRAAGTDHFQAAVRQGTGTWKLDACPMDGGAVFARADGSFGTVWRRENSVYLSFGVKNERLLGKGMQPVGLESKGGIHILWQNGSDLMHLDTAGSGAASVLARGATYPATALSPIDGSIIVVYERTVGGRRGIAAEIIK